MGGTPLSRVVRSRAARLDLVDVWTYVAGVDPAAADRLLDRVLAKLEMLADNPGVGSPRSELATNLRSLSVRPYLLFYRPLTDGIELVRVLHGARDLSAVEFG